MHFERHAHISMEQAPNGVAVRALAPFSYLSLDLLRLLP